MRDVSRRTVDFAPDNISHLDQTALGSLTTVNWDFPDRIAHTDLEGIHPYPAKFIAQIPRALLEALPVISGTAVLDPFCGSGTTLVECQRRNIPSIGIDLNPIACLMSRVKTTKCSTELRAHAIRTLERVKSQPPSAIPAIPNLDHWFEPAIQRKLASLTQAINSGPDSAKDYLRLALSSIVVRVSNQESDTRYAAINKHIPPESVSSLFLRAVERIESALQGRSYSLSPASVIEGDTLQITPHQIDLPIGLVVTSPPYPNAYEYWLYHKYRMWWLGFDPLSVKALEIGARAHFFKKNHHTANDFVRQMRQTFALLGRVVVPGGYVCFVIGRSRIHGQVVDNAKIIGDAGRAYDFRQYFVTDRVMAAHRKSFNLSHANIKTETILVLRKEPS